jgi:hypothetical protein
MISLEGCERKLSWCVESSIKKFPGGTEEKHETLLRRTGVTFEIKTEHLLALPLDQPFPVHFK